MTSKDILQIETKLDNVNDSLIEFKATFTEKFKHIITIEDVKKEVTSQIQLYNAKKSHNSSDKIKAIATTPLNKERVAFWGGVITLVATNLLQLFGVF